MRNILLLACLVMVIAGCSTLKRSQKRLFYVQRDNPELLAKYCAEEFPITSDTFFTDPVVVRTIDTIPGETKYVNCDSIAVAASKTPLGSKERKAAAAVPVQCPDYIQTHDSVTYLLSVVQENTAARDTMARSLEKEKESRIKAESKAGTWSKIAIGLGIGIIVLAALMFLLFRKKVSII